MGLLNQSEWRVRIRRVMMQPTREQAHRAIEREFAGDRNAMIAAEFVVDHYGAGLGWRNVFMGAGE